MAIIKTGAIFRSLTFGSVNSADYGVYITGEAVYNAPTRAVEFVDVPGRNGALILDAGHWNNIQVKYPAGIFASDQPNFRANFAAFRNAVASQIGYQRLSDTYNPNEYRMAAYVSGVELAPTGYGQAGEFDLVFDCKPQRWLTSGETPETVASSGDTVTNPTLYESSPLIVAEGYGEIGINGFEMEIFDIPIGAVSMYEQESRSAQIYTTETPSWTFPYNVDSFQIGDTITISGATFTWRHEDNFNSGTGTGYKVTNFNTGSGSGYADVTWLPKTWGAVFSFPDIQFTVGTDSVAQYTRTNTIAGVRYVGGSATQVKSDTQVGVATVTHDATAGTITFSFSSSMDVADWTYNGETMILEQSVAITFAGISGMSTKPVTQDIYIDTEIGEAYTIQGGEPVSLNNSVSIGSDLPVLAPGSNLITFDNTITSLQIVGRWWEL